ncbi:hypothetical protein V1511DRAFT_460829 [Dipodascopsis uninucleata]
MKVFSSLCSTWAFGIALLGSILLKQVCAETRCPISNIEYSVFSADADTEIFLTSCKEGADGPKTTPINETSYDWWYFDVVSPDAKNGIVVVFMVSSPEAFAPTSFADNTAAYIFLTVNGTTTVDLLPALGASVVTNGNGASGNWTITGIDFIGNEDATEYTITIDNKLVALNGIVTFKSVAPGHYPCNALVGGVSESVAAHIGWVNVIPDANSTVELTQNGTDIAFTGYGYHDKNWSDMPFVSAVSSWYWGHGRLGPYSLVYFDTLGTDGKEYLSGYLALDGKIVSSKCSGVKVRPIGSPYPPTVTDDPPEGLTLLYEFETGKYVNVTITPESVSYNGVGSQRWLATMKGTVDDSAEILTGSLYLEMLVTAI